MLFCLGSQIAEEIRKEEKSSVKKVQQASLKPHQDLSQGNQCKLILEKVAKLLLICLGRKRKQRCGQCPGCNTRDCNECKYCLDKKKNGGPGIKKQCCIKRKCIRTAKAEADIKTSISRLQDSMDGKIFYRGLNFED